MDNWRLVRYSVPLLPFAALFVAALIAQLRKQRVIRRGIARSGRRSITVGKSHRLQDRFEWAPRALGNRSILGDPRNANMKDIINTKIKFREPYRPFAPSVLAECAEPYFDLPNAAHHYPARYVLYVVPARPAKQAILPAITHVDGTGHLQTVFRDATPDTTDWLSALPKPPAFRRYSTPLSILRANPS